MKKILICTVAAGLLFGFSSCKKYLDINENPNQATRPPINGLLARATYDAGMNVYRVSNTTSYYVQYLASPNPNGASDTYEPIDLSGTWTQLYDNLTDSYDLYELGNEVGSNRYKAVARIIMAMDLIHIHDLWGSAPFTQAFTGEFITPVYDDAQSIYGVIMSYLDEGISLLGQTNPGINLPTNNNDLIHNGNVQAWIKTAHALKARMLNRLSKTSQYNAQAVLDEVDMAYTSIADDADLTTFDVRNPWAQAALNNSNLVLDAWLSKHLVDAYTGTTFGVEDPRITRIATLTQFGDYRGTANGLGRIGSGTDDDESYLSMDGYYAATASPVSIATYEEICFIEAEAAFRANDLERAFDAYTRGITANFNRLAIPAQDRDDYLSSEAIAQTEGELTLQHIFDEKYKALFLSPETWSDARRFDYGYTDFSLPANAKTNTFVRRIVYPGVEQSTNGNNVPNVDDVTARLWWDQ